MRPRNRFAVLFLILVVLVLAGCQQDLLSVVTSQPQDTTQKEMPSPSPTASQAAPTATSPRTPAVTPSVTPTATWVPTAVPQAPSPTPTSAPTIVAEILDIMDGIEDEVQTLRGLEETTPVARALMTRPELGRYLRQEFEKENTPQELEEDIRVLHAFDLIPLDFDLEGLLLGLYSTQILGFYEDEDDTFFVVSDDEFDWMDRVTYAHEFIHGLQDAHFNLETFVDDETMDDDMSLARMALVEGDATLSMYEYLWQHLQDLSEDDLSSFTESDTGDRDLLDDAPPFLLETLDFPYTYGYEFVAILRKEGWEAVDAAFADPPQSTEQILHPARYLDRDEPQLVVLPPLTDTLGTGWHLVETEVLGEFSMALWLDLQLERAEADTAAAGWDGDQYAVYVRDEDHVLALSVVWDSEADTNEFVEAYSNYASLRYAIEAKHNGSEREWQGEDQTARIVWTGMQTLVVIGPDPCTVDAIAGQF